MRCHAWPLIGLPFCDTHDPQRIEVQRQQRASARSQFDRIKMRLAQAYPRIAEQALELLILHGKVKAQDVEDVLRKYRLFN